jgi:hypothetical protein
MASRHCAGSYALKDSRGRRVAYVYGYDLADARYVVEKLRLLPKFERKLGFRHLDPIWRLLDSDESDLIHSWPLDFLLRGPEVAARIPPCGERPWPSLPERSA